MSENKKNVPKIRFPGFTEDWEQRKLGEVAEIRRGLTYKPSSIREIGIRVLRSSNIDEDTFVMKNDDVFVDSNAINIDYIKEGDILITSANGSSRLVGKHAIVQGVGDKEAVHGGFMLIAQSNQPEFLNASMNSSWYKKFINIYVSGGNGAIGNLSKSDLEEQIIMVPGMDEQRKIGSFFKQLDNLITLHQRKLNNVQNLKAGLLQKMFPKDGEEFPEIRFPEFTQAWEQRKLGELGSVVMNKRIFKDQTSEVGDVPFYKIGTFGGEPDAYIPRELFEEYKAKYPYPKVGDILISASGSIGRTVEYTGEDEYFQDSNIVWLKHDGKLNNLFLKQFYMVVKWEGLEGSTIKRLYNKNILETQILLPSLAEQERIGVFFQQLDNLITLHQRKLEHLQEQKKALLQQMFV